MTYFLSLSVIVIFQQNFLNGPSLTDYDNHQESNNIRKDKSILKKNKL